MANETKSVPTGAHPFGDWLTVQEAVAYALSKGLNRTPKTIRKWALRSQNVESGFAEIIARTQDTENGFRWLIERVSLDVKIAQELEFEARKRTEAADVDSSRLVPTGAHHSEGVQPNEFNADPAETGSYLSTPVGTGAVNDTGYAEFLEKQLDRAHQQLDVKDRQIDALLERDRETNILIQGLQTSLTRVVEALPDGRRDLRDAA